MVQVVILKEEVVEVGKDREEEEEVEELRRREMLSSSPGGRLIGIRAVVERGRGTPPLEKRGGGKGGEWR